MFSLNTVGRCPLAAKKNHEAATVVSIVLIGFLVIILGNRSPAKASAPGEDAFPPLGIRLSQPVVTVGDITIVEIDGQRKGPSLEDLGARFLDIVIPLFDHPIKGSDTRIGLIPIPYKTSPGVKTLFLEWTDSAGHHRHPIPLEIRGGRFQSEKLQVTASRVIPPKKMMPRIQREREEIKAAYSRSQPLRCWDAPFQRPTTGKVTSAYGAQRLLNGKLQRYHGGVDFRAASGTPIYAANSGVVRLAKNLFYSGNHVILDHGEGLFTSYSHLSHIDVSTGQSVARGQVIGKSGSTGRVSGPHLHWSVKVHGVNVDPLRFINALDTLLDHQNPSFVAAPQ